MSDTAKQLEDLSDAMLRTDADMMLPSGMIDPRTAAEELREKDATIAQLREEVESLTYASRTRADYDIRCSKCGAAHNVDTSIPSDIWNQIAEPHELLCTLCIDEALNEKGLTCEAAFYFVGDALTGKLYSRHEKARADKAEAALAKATAAICWALGEEGDFQPRGEGQPTYWWRKELRRLASLTEGEKE